MKKPLTLSKTARLCMLAVALYLIVRGDTAEATFVVACTIFAALEFGP